MFDDCATPSKLRRLSCMRLCLRWRRCLATAVPCSERRIARIDCLRHKNLLRIRFRMKYEPGLTLQVNDYKNLLGKD